jgi:hypothetical protein
MHLNLHEGGANNILLMSTKTRGQIFSSDKTEAYYKVDFKDNYMIIDNKKYIKAPAEENGLNILVNRTLFAGKYGINNETIQFSESGQIFGLDSIIHYDVNLDYADAGMQYDKIYLQFRNEKEPRTYLYEFVADSLVIFHIVCLSEDEEDNYCLEVEKGKEFIKLKKK